MIKQNFTADAFKNFSDRIISCQTLQEIYEIGKELTQFELNGYKRAILFLYKDRKKELVQAMLKENNIFSNLFYIIVTSNIQQLKNVGKLLYNIKNLGILSREEINELFETFEQRKIKLSKENENNEIFEQETFEQEILEHEIAYNDEEV